LYRLSSRPRNRLGRGHKFATLAFRAERDFLVRHEESGETQAIAHRDGHVIYLPHPMNITDFNAVPKRKRVKACRISLILREIVPQSRTT